MTRMTGSVPSSMLDVDLSRGVGAPGEARRAVGPVLRRIDPTLLPTTELLVSELVANSVRHGATRLDDPVRLEVLVSRDALRVEVSDHGPGFTPAPQPEPAADMIGAWGLVIIDRAAARWGTRDGGRCVWFELERNGHAA
jgi:anti-sigma regulatory factor (Ser/Thr protein kinase)